MSFKVHVLNPPKVRKKTNKRTAKAAKRNTTMASQPKKKGRRRRRRNPETVAVEPNRSRRRRRKGSSGVSRQRRRRNPEGGGLGTGWIMREANLFAPRLLGKLWVAFVVRRFGASGSMFGGATNSPLMGGSWGMGQYLAAIIGTAVGAKIFGRFVNAAEFRKGAIDLILTKAVWTEGIARSPWMQQTFGNTEGQVAWDPNTGQMSIYQGGRWDSMQGLVEASPMDGLVEASPMDGPNDYQYGHLLPENTSRDLQRTGAYSGGGHANNFSAAYSYR